MNDEQPTQPITDAELMAINYNLNEALNRCGELYLVTDAPKDMRRLLVEVDRLRAEMSGVRTALINAHEAGMSLGQDVERLRNEATGAALGHLAKIDRLQSERDALVRKLGLDWVPDEFGDLSAVHVQSIEITNCPDEYCPGWKDSGICPNDYRHRY